MQLSYYKIDHNFKIIIVIYYVIQVLQNHTIFILLINYIFVQHHSYIVIYAKIYPIFIYNVNK